MRDTFTSNRSTLVSFVIQTVPHAALFRKTFAQNASLQLLIYMFRNAMRIALMGSLKMRLVDLV